MPVLVGVAESPAPVFAGGSGSSVPELAEDPSAVPVGLAAVVPVLVGGPLNSMPVFPVAPVLDPLAPPTGAVY